MNKNNTSTAVIASLEAALATANTAASAAALEIQRLQRELDAAKIAADLAAAMAAQKAAPRPLRQRVEVCLISTDGKVGLALSAAGGNPYLVGGGIEEGQTALEAAQAELHEELRLEPRRWHRMPEVFEVDAPSWEESWDGRVPALAKQADRVQQYRGSVTRYCWALVDAAKAVVDPAELYVLWWGTPREALERLEAAGPRGASRAAALRCALQCWGYRWPKVELTPDREWLHTHAWTGEVLYHGG